MRESAFDDGGEKVVGAREIERNPPPTLKTPTGARGGGNWDRGFVGPPVVEKLKTNASTPWKTYFHKNPKRIDATHSKVSREGAPDKGGNQHGRYAVLLEKVNKTPNAGESLK